LFILIFVLGDIAGSANENADADDVLQNMLKVPILLVEVMVRILAADIMAHGSALVFGGGGSGDAGEFNLRKVSRQDERANST
jgi:hypothetical protein